MIKIILVCIVAIIISVVWLRYFERTNIYFPTRRIEATPADYHWEFEDVAFNADDGYKIHGWFIPSIRNNSQIILFAHGNGGNISHRLEKIGLLREIGFDVFIFDYHGYGKSQGSPSEAGIYNDAKAAYDYLINQKKIPPASIIGYGESLGASVIIDLANRAQLKAIILEGVFSCIRDMAQEIYPFLPGCLIQSKFDSLRKIKSITVPKLFIHSPDDEIVPFDLGQKVYNNAPEPKYFTRIGGGHNTFFLDSPQEYKQTLTSFMEKL